MPAPKKYPDELRERAVRLYRESDPRPSFRRLADQLNVHHEALRSWVRQAEADNGERHDRPSTDMLAESRRPATENAELRRANQVLRAASAYVASEIGPARAVVMSVVDKTPEGRYRAYVRDPSGKQRSTTFRLKNDATGFLAKVETSKSRGAYVSPHGARVRFADHAAEWIATWNVEATTAGRDRSIMNTHVLPRWGDDALGRIDHLTLQGWVTELGKRRSRATVVEALRLASAVLRSAVRNRLIPFQPGRRGPGAAIAHARYRRATMLPIGPTCSPGRGRCSVSSTTCGPGRPAPGE